MAATYHLLSNDSYKRICNVIHSLDDVLTNINDNFDATNMVWSSQRITEAFEELQTAMEEEANINLSAKTTIGIEACPADADMVNNKLYFEQLTDADGDNYYDCNVSIENVGKVFLGSSIFKKETYFTKEDMDNRYAAVDIIDKNAYGAPVSSKGLYSIINQEKTAFDNQFLSTHDNLAIPNIEQEGLIVGNIFPIGEGYILESYRNGFGYWLVKLVRGTNDLAAETPSAAGADTIISEVLSNKDEFAMPIAAWPELRDYVNNDEWVIPLQSTLMYIDEKHIRYSAELVIKNVEGSVNANTAQLYLRASSEIPTGTVLYGSTCFTINHTR
jgi:hypothetical protein